MPEAVCQFAAETPCLAMCAFLKHNDALRLLMTSRADVNAKDWVAVIRELKYQIFMVGITMIYGI